MIKITLTNKAKKDIKFLKKKFRKITQDLDEIFAKFYRIIWT